MQNKNKFDEFVIKYKIAIYTFLIILMGFICFYGGVIFSCQNGYLRGFSCIQPQKVATVSVCEYNPMTCVANCKNAIVNDIKQFCDTYNKQVIN